MINQVKLLAAVLAGWISRRQQQAIDYLVAENKVLKEKLGKKRILLNDKQRRQQMGRITFGHPRKTGLVAGLLVLG